MARGIQYGTIGELWQGPYQSSDGTLDIAIVTLPCERYVSEVTVEYGRSDLQPLPKSALAIRRFISYFDIELSASNYAWSVRSNIPQAIGMSSSTADVVATIYALASLHKVQLTANHIQDILRGIERSDPVFHQEPGLYLSKHQRFVRLWHWKPKFNVIYSILPGVTATESVSELELLSFYQDNLGAYEASLIMLDNGFQAEDAAIIGSAATECAGIFQSFCPIKLIDDLINMSSFLGALGVVRAYTGHIAGLLFSNEDESYIKCLPVIHNLFDDYGLPTLVDRAGYGTT